MYIRDGIAYGGEITPPIEICGIRALDDYVLWMRFNTGETKTFDFKPLLNEPAFLPLSDKTVFRDVYIDYGIPTWMNGDIDLSPGYLYENSTPVIPAIA